MGLEESFVGWERGLVRACLMRARRWLFVCIERWSTSLVYCFVLSCWIYVPLRYQLRSDINDNAFAVSSPSKHISRFWPHWKCPQCISHIAISWRPLAFHIPVWPLLFTRRGQRIFVGIGLLSSLANLVCISVLFCIILLALSILMCPVFVN